MRSLKARSDILVIFLLCVCESITKTEKNSDEDLQVGATAVSAHELLSIT